MLALWWALHTLLAALDTVVGAWRRVSWQLNLPSPTRRYLHPLRTEIINTMEATIEFSPAIPWPQPPDIQKRIQELRSYLDPNNPNYQPEQHTNIEAAIKLYEDGKIDWVQQVFIMDGKVVPREEIFGGSSWSLV
jgi:hypothetical protein